MVVVSKLNGLNLSCKERDLFYILIIFYYVIKDKLFNLFLFKFFYWYNCFIGFYGRLNDMFLIFFY